MPQHWTVLVRWSYDRRSGLHTAAAVAVDGRARTHSARTMEEIERPQLAGIPTLRTDSLVLGSILSSLLLNVSAERTVTGTICYTSA